MFLTLGNYNFGRGGFKGNPDSSQLNNWHGLSAIPLSSKVCSNRSKYLLITSSKQQTARACASGSGFRNVKFGCRFLKEFHHPVVTLTFCPFSLFERVQLFLCKNEDTLKRHILEETLPLQLHSNIWLVHCGIQMQHVLFMRSCKVLLGTLYSVDDCLTDIPSLTTAK